MLNDTFVRNVGERIDQIMSLDVPSRNVHIYTILFRTEKKLWSFVHECG
jgi:hypothetical protein